MSNAIGTKIQDKEARMLLILGGVVILFLVWRLVCTPLSDSNNQMKQEIESIRGRNIELQKMTMNEQEYKTRTEEMLSEADKVFADIPAGILSEDKIILTTDLEKDYEYEISTVGMGADTQIYALNGAGQNEADAGKALYSTTMSIQGVTTYDGLKNCLRSLKIDGEKMAIQQASFSYNAETGGLSGSMDFSLFYLTGGDTTYTPAVIDGVAIGTGNIFGGISGGASDSDKKEDSTEDDSDKEDTEEDTEKDTEKEESKTDSKKK